MAHAATHANTSYYPNAEASTKNPTYQAYQILHVAFIIAPIIAGLDKFTHLLVNWDMYLSPAVSRMIPFDAHTFMVGVGLVEIIAGLLVAVMPYVGGYVVAVWLWGIIINLLMMRGYYDIALRDFGLSLGAVALARLSLPFHRRATS
jgi:hypothetical protein